MVQNRMINFIVRVNQTLIKTLNNKGTYNKTK